MVSLPIRTPAKGGGGEEKPISIPFLREQGLRGARNIIPKYMKVTLRPSAPPSGMRERSKESSGGAEAHALRLANKFASLAAPPAGGRRVACIHEMTKVMR